MQLICPAHLHRGVPGNRNRQQVLCSASVIDLPGLVPCKGIDSLINGITDNNHPNHLLGWSRSDGRNYVNTGCLCLFSLFTQGHPHQHNPWTVMAPLLITQGRKWLALFNTWSFEAAHLKSTYPNKGMDRSSCRIQSFLLRPVDGWDSCCQ